MAYVLIEMADADAERIVRDDPIMLAWGNNSYEITHTLMIEGEERAQQLGSIQRYNPPTEG